MILEFSFGNFRSFKDMQSLKMTAAKITSKNKELDSNNIFKILDNQLLKSKAIYGANASGKSNVVKAFVAFREIVLSSVKNDKILEIISPFELSTATKKEPTYFQLIFLLNGTKFRYGFEANQEEITSEWLYGTPNVREVCYFVREGNKIIDISKRHFNEGFQLLSIYKEDGDDNQLFRSNSLLLTTLGALNRKLSKQLQEKINLITSISGLDDELLHSVAEKMLEKWGNSEFSKFLKLADTGIDAVEAVAIKNSDEKELNSYHKIYDEAHKKIGTQNFSFMKDESEGTKKIFGLSPWIITVLKGGGTLFIDEFDARLHPLITKKIVELFNSKANKKGAQLIFITHDTNLLSGDLLRRDQIEFTEKDKYGASHLYSLAQFKGVRNSASFEKDYIRGKYGAIPFIGNLKELLFNHEEDAKEVKLHQENRQEKTVE